MSEFPVESMYKLLCQDPFNQKTLDLSLYHTSNIKGFLRANNNIYVYSLSELTDVEKNALISEINS